MGKIYGLQLFYDELNSQDVLFYTDSTKGIIGRIHISLRGLFFNFILIYC